MSRYLRSAPRPDRPRVDFILHVAPKAERATERWMAAFLSEPSARRDWDLNAYNEALRRLNLIGS